MLYLALVLGKPLLLEGEAGVGKTEVAKILADALGARLIRLQCYEGIDVAHALYEWTYARQMLYIRTLEAAADADGARSRTCSGRDFLVRRPLLDAIEHDDPVPPVLLVDEIDRADDEFEAFLLELLSDFQVTIPEIGTIVAQAAAGRRPHVEPHARAARRAQAPLPVPLDRRTRRSSARSPSCAPGCRAFRSGSRPQAAAFVATAARRSTSRSAPASPRRSTGRHALAALGEEELEAGWSTPPSAPC